MLMVTLAIATLMLGACSAPLHDLAGGRKPTGVQGWESADTTEQRLGVRSVNHEDIQLLGIGGIADYVYAFYFTYGEAHGLVGIVARFFEHGATSRQSWPKEGPTTRDGSQTGDASTTVYATDNDQFSGLVVADVSSAGQTWQLVASGFVQFSSRIGLGLAGACGNETSTFEPTYLHVRLVDDGVNLGDSPSQPSPLPSPSPAPAPSPNPDPMPDPNPGPKSQTKYELDSTANFLNPERGFHSDVNLFDGTGLDDVRGHGYSLVRSYVRLDDFRSGPISSAFLSNLRTGLQQLRSSGVKVVLRFSYNFGYAPDAPLDIVLQHIDQLEPILREYADVISVMQAGFIGAWGEWHESTNGLTSTSSMRAIADALLDALPTSRMIQLRVPAYRRDVVGEPSGQVDMFDGSAEARIGFVNDCFLSSANDAGTYSGNQTKDRNEAADYSRYTVTGGETCSVDYPNSRQDCSVALRELANFHWDYLNSGYYPGVLNRWRAQGCYGEIERRLGYRLALQTGAATSGVNPGGVLTLDLTVRNDGFGKVYNPRPIDIVLRNIATGEVRVVRAVNDARKLLPLAGEALSIRLSVSLPSNLPAGEYALLLSLPDAASTLAGDIRYNVRLANIGTWEAGTGLNNLGLTIQVHD